MEVKIDNNICNFNYDENNNIYECDLIRDSWKNNLNNQLIEERLRNPQKGALYALKSFYTIDNKEATIVMPTGTGKTETMLVYIVSECLDKTIIIVPSSMLREQTFNKCKTMGLIKKFGILEENAILPNVSMINHIPSSADSLEEILEKSNIIITTINIVAKFNEEYMDLLNKFCSDVIIDEAHHIAATSWNKFKNYMRNKRIVQFTATPFRNDNKKIDGKIVYNYPLNLAQREGYFTKINFLPVIEYDLKNSDLAVAEKSIKVLQNDLEKGLNHVMLVRASTQVRAKQLYDDIYNKFYDKYNPVLIISSNSKSLNKENLTKLKSFEAKIVVCVDMFGEGIDIPNLKIAAIHDKYKSLPITLQFVGRFARVNGIKIGEASLIANIIKDDVNDEIRTLYSQDSNWDYIISDLSKTAIEKEISFQDFMDNFDKKQLSEISIKQLMPKVSMIAYRTKINDWKIEQWKKIFDEDKSVISINEENNLFVIVQAVESILGWTSNRAITNKNLELHVVYWNKDKNVVFINSTNKSAPKLIAEKIFETKEIIKGDITFRPLHGIKRLMMASVGLRTRLNGPIRYKMFTGVDIADAISQAEAGQAIKSNIFGTGFNGNGRVSIGCSYKGTIWSKWVETIDFWKKWCDDVIDKVNDDTINTTDILKSALVPEVIKVRPKLIPISIEFPMELELEEFDKYSIQIGVKEYDIYELEINIVDNLNCNENIKFTIDTIDGKSYLFELLIKNKSYQYINNSGKKIELYRNGTYIDKIENYFYDNPPLIYFEDQSSLEGNLYTQSKDKIPECFDISKVTKLDWTGTDISKESQTKEKLPDSIQYKIIQMLKQTGKYSIIFDDDGSGEIADIITIYEEENNVQIEFYHCKYSKEKTPGKRVSDLYEVCGQCQKSIKWKSDLKKMIDRMLARESKASEKGYSRIELGSKEELYKMKQIMRTKKCKLSIKIVQPGVDSSEISEQMYYLLCCTQSFLLDTYTVDLSLICS